ncbi:DUF317 domain-containing protein [Streptomyces sp. NPDC020192]|uniref:DUF317 domain-containing protein n=1 Tax=Streptomyces sp. NPDC020192 TaxID=3365066 RepID=UPI003787474B
MPDAFDSLEPDQTVTVLPRHLAGRGSADLRTIWPFPFDDDWSLYQHAEDGSAVASSPCLRLRTGYVPDPDRPGHMQWITAAHHSPFGPATWQITFDATTPVELLRDTHAELLDLYLEGRHSTQDPLFDDRTPPHEAYAPLLARGWSHMVKTDGTQHFLAPDIFGGVQHKYAEPRLNTPAEPAWTAWAGYADDPHWRVRFSRATPTTLVAAFTASLLSTEPVQRTVKDVPLRTRDRVYVASATATPQQKTPAAPVASPASKPTVPRRTR